MGQRLRVLISAYACEPDRGSEPEVGWQWALQMARLHDTTVITRANNRPAIESALQHHSGPRPVFQYYDLPAWMRFWKRGARGVQLYYILWQKGILDLARSLHSTQEFDVVHHVTFGKFSVPSSLARLPVPLILGPVGGGESTPPGFASTYSLQGRLFEASRDAARKLALLNPSTRSLLRRARLIAATPETSEWLERISSSRRSVLVEPQCGMKDADLIRFASFPIRTEGPFRLISIARLVHWKGIHLALQAFAQFVKRNPGSEYWIVSGGPEQERLKRLATELGLDGKVTFWGRLPALSQVYDKLADSDALVHPALHEAFGYACLEALAAGRPVICLSCGGPGVQVTEECGFAVAPREPQQVISDLAAAMEVLCRRPELRTRLAEAARARARNAFRWEAKASRMDTIYQEVAREPLGTSNVPH